MFVRTRRRFRAGDKDWHAYLEALSFQGIEEVRTIDSALNGYAQGFGDIETSPGDLERSLKMLPVPSSDEYYLLAVNLDGDFPPLVFPQGTLLGYDLSDETETSSLLNCGPWQGKLKPLAARLNSFGLLSEADAREAQRVLPEEWGQSADHTDVDVWALYEMRVT